MTVAFVSPLRVLSVFVAGRFLAKTPRRASDHSNAAADALGDVFVVLLAFAPAIYIFFQGGSGTRASMACARREIAQHTARRTLSYRFHP